MGHNIHSDSVVLESATLNRVYKLLVANVMSFEILLCIPLPLA